jgi:pectin methylesterase-like acyl-CoA thioesterase
MYGIKSLAVCSGIISLLGSISPAQAATRSVCKSGCQYTRINAAIEAAASGDTISIAAGTYFENVVVSDKSLTINGYSEDYTVIDGGFQGTTLAITGQSPSTNTVTLNKLTLTHGSVSGLAITSAAVTMFKVVVISNISANNGAGAGAGILALDSNVTIDKSIIAHNRAATGQGGGIYADRTAVIGSNFTITNSDIFDNSAINGGGLYIGPQSTITMTSSTLTSNSATDGAGAYIGAFRHSAVEEIGFLTFNSSTMANNQAGDMGGGIYVSIEAPGGAFTHSFIVGNRAGNSGGGIALPEFGSVSLTHTVLTGNSPDNCAPAANGVCP